VDSFSKQPYEAFVIYGDIVDVQLAGEAIAIGNSSVVAEDKDGNDVSTVVLDQSTIAVGDSPDGGTSNILQIQCRAGVGTESPYKVSFKMETDQNNKWEVDVKMKVKEL